MTDQEMRDSLFPVLGVYGDWLVEHGRKLDQGDELVQEIMRAYQMFYDCSDPAAAILLMMAIDGFCQKRNFNRPADHVAHNR